MHRREAFTIEIRRKKKDALIVAKRASKVREEHRPASRDGTNLTAIIILIQHKEPHEAVHGNGSCGKQPLTTAENDNVQPNPQSNHQASPPLEANRHAMDVVPVITIVNQAPSLDDFRARMEDMAIK